MTRSSKIASFLSVLLSFSLFAKGSSSVISLTASNTFTLLNFAITRMTAVVSISVIRMTIMTFRSVFDDFPLLLELFFAELVFFTILPPVFFATKRHRRQLIQPLCFAIFDITLIFSPIFFFHLFKLSYFHRSFQ